MEALMRTDADTVLVDYYTHYIYIHDIQVTNKPCNFTDTTIF